MRFGGSYKALNKASHTKKWSIDALLIKRLLDPHGRKKFGLPSPLGRLGRITNLDYMLLSPSDSLYIKGVEISPKFLVFILFTC
jgi:hypothetical protein